MGGYIARTEPAAGTHDPLFVKAAAFRHGSKAAILLVLDALYVSHAWTAKLRAAISNKTGVPQKNILVAATHTHSGPAVFSPLAGERERMAAYEASLHEACAEAAIDALRAVEPARLRVGRGEAKGIGAYRRDPRARARARAADTVSVVRVENRRGKVLGHLVSFPCHPTVMGATNLHYSADLFGASAAQVEKTYKNSECLMFTGAAGDVSTRFVRREQTWAEMERLGGKLGRGVTAASRASRPAKADPIAASSVTMSLPLRELPSPEKAQEALDKALRKAEQAKNDRRTSHATERLGRSMVEGAAATLFLSRLGGWQSIFGAETAHVELQTIRIGDIIVCGLPGEFFSMRERDLKRAARPKFTLVAGYANGYWGYVVPPEEAAKGGYETMMAPLEPRHEPEIIRKAEELIRKVKEKPPKGKGSANA